MGSTQQHAVSTRVKRPRRRLGPISDLEERGDVRLLARTVSADPRTGSRSMAPTTLTRALQRSAGNRAVTAVLQRFEGPEHRDIGAASPLGAESLSIDLGGGEKLPYRDMVAMAGDMFESLDEMRKLAETDTGRAKLRWARWYALDKKGPEPPLSDSDKKAIEDRYYKLASRNYSHFSGGGTARPSYREHHRRALTQAVLSGCPGYENFWQDALTEEAFGNHYLTDSFSGGHIRTPRTTIKVWYQARFPNSIDRFVDYMLGWLYHELLNLRFRLQHPPIGDTSEIPVTQGEWAIESGLNDRIREKAGGALEAFSLGDLISGAFHDHDNKRLFVISDADPTGNEVSGGYRWEAKGDGHLNESPDTANMVGAAMKATQSELLAARQQGRTNANALSRDPWYTRYMMAMAEADAFGPPYAAERFIPREDTSGKIQVLEWAWGSINDEMAGAIQEKLKTVANKLRQVAPTKPEEVWGVGAWFAGVNGIHLHVDVAFQNFAALLESDGLRVIERAMGAKAR